MFISVDLPAPFSPRRAWISPRRTSRSMPALASTPGNPLVMPPRTTLGGVPAGNLTEGWTALSIGLGPGRSKLRSGVDSRNSLDRPIPVIKRLFRHPFAFLDADGAGAVLDLADEGTEAAKDLVAHGVG